MCDAAGLSDRVRRFYGEMPFPRARTPDRDGLLLMRRIASRNARPGRPLEVLDAGCGTGNTTVSLARLRPDARFRAVDFCAASLGIARDLAARAGVENILFVEGDLREPGTLGGPHDVVLSLGVLHHLPDPAAGLRSLASALAAGGDLYLWVYGAHGRHRHELNRRFLERLLPRDLPLAERVAVARAFAVGNEDPFPLSDLLGRDFADPSLRAEALLDSFIADQFLHVHELAMDMPGLLAHLDAAGLRLEEWLGPEDAHGPPPVGPPELARALAALPERERRAALDLYLKPDRYFVRIRHARGGPLP